MVSSRLRNMFYALGCRGAGSAGVPVAPTPAAPAPGTAAGAAIPPPVATSPTVAPPAAAAALPATPKKRKDPPGADGGAENGGKDGGGELGGDGETPDPPPLPARSTKSPFRGQPTAAQRAIGFEPPAEGTPRFEAPGPIGSFFGEGSATGEGSHWGSAGGGGGLGVGWEGSGGGSSAGGSRSWDGVPPQGGSEDLGVKLPSQVAGGVPGIQMGSASGPASGAQFEGGFGAPANLPKILTTSAGDNRFGGPGDTPFQSGGHSSASSAQTNDGGSQKFAPGQPGTAASAMGGAFKSPFKDQEGGSMDGASKGFASTGYAAPEGIPPAAGGSAGIGNSASGGGGVPGVTSGCALALGQGVSEGVKASGVGGSEAGVSGEGQKVALTDEEVKGVWEGVKAGIAGLTGTPYEMLPKLGVPAEIVSKLMGTLTPEQILTRWSIILLKEGMKKLELGKSGAEK